MATGRNVVLTVEAKGVRKEGIAVGAISPGECVTVDTAVAAVGGRHSWEAANVGDADGARALVAVADIDQLQGKTISDAYADGDRVFIYCPQPGDELNVLVKANVADLDVGDLLMIEAASGLCIASTGVIEMEPFEVLEDSNTSASTRLVHVQYTGH